MRLAGVEARRNLRTVRREVYSTITFHRRIIRLSIENSVGKPLRRGRTRLMRGEDRLGCRIDLAESGVRGVKGSDGGGLGIDARSDTNSGGAGSVHGGPEAGADAS